MSFLYLEHFGLSKAPFQITPDIGFFFSGSHRGDILTALLHVAQHEEGIAVAVAEVGSGKTLLARMMLSQLPEGICSIYLANPCFSRDEIVSAIGRDLGLTELPESIEGKLAALHQELLDRHARGERVLLVIDEAHAMPVESLEEVRLLSNLETSHHKLVNIMLFGQPELDTLLADHRLRQVRDRVIHRFELPPLTREEGSAYIDHRLRTAGWRGGKLFSATATQLLLKASGGRARRINLLADKSLLAAYAEGNLQIEERHVRSAMQDLQADPVPASGVARIPWRQIIPISVALALVMTSFALWVIDRSRAPSMPSPTHQTAVASVPPAAASPTPAPAVTPLAPPTPIRPSSKPAPTPMAALPGATPAPPGKIAATDPGAAVLGRTAEWLKDSSVRGYTLQLAALPAGADLTNYLKFIGSNVESPVVYAHNRVYKGKSFMAVYLGHYASEQEARTALNALPAPLKAGSPLIRTWSGIRQESQQ